MPAKLLVKRNPFRAPPSWVADAVIYQIVPDRFRRSGLVKTQDQMELRPWGTDPVAQGFQGPRALPCVQVRLKFFELAIVGHLDLSCSLHLGLLFGIFQNYKS